MLTFSSERPLPGSEVSRTVFIWKVAGGKPAAAVNASISGCSCQGLEAIGPIGHDRVRTLCMLTRT